ncbi:MAG: diacylglycerol/polyprenol kinase family protein [archaeon]
MKLEFKRKMFHMSSGLLFAYLLHAKMVGLMHFIVLLCIALPLSYACRICRIPVVSWLLTQLDRPADRKAFPGKGSVFLLLGVICSLILFERETALASITILALGDAVSPLVGPYGRIRHPLNRKKKIEGTIAGIFAAFLGALFFVTTLQAMLGAFFAMLAESLDTKIDDNLVIPLVAGAVISLVMLI